MNNNVRKKLSIVAGASITLILIFAFLVVCRKNNNGNKVLRNTSSAQTELTKDQAGATQPNQDPNLPKDWVLYTNPYGYQISYPQSWYAFDDSKNAPNVVSEYNLCPLKPDSNVYTPRCYLQIIISNKSYSESAFSLSANATVEDYTLNDVQGKIIKQNNQSGNTDSIEYLFPVKNYSVQINSLNYKDFNQLDLKKVLSTFKIN